MLAGSELVQSWFELDSVMEFGFEPVCDELQTSSEPASVMEFGFYAGVDQNEFLGCSFSVIILLVLSLFLYTGVRIT